MTTVADLGIRAFEVHTPEEDLTDPRAASRPRASPAGRRHFAAREEPGLFAAEIRAAFRSLR